jgi:hypothetical protein
VAFNGDYHALAGQRYRRVRRHRVRGFATHCHPRATRSFIRRLPTTATSSGYVWAGPPATSFTFAGVTQEAENGFEINGTCSASGETTRDQTVWTPGDSPRSRVPEHLRRDDAPGPRDGVAVGKSKPTGALERAYVIFVQNLTGQDRQYQMNVANQPGGRTAGGTGRASFRPDSPTVPPTNCVPGTDCRTINVTIPRRIELTRTVLRALRRSRARESWSPPRRPVVPRTGPCS